MRTDVQTVFLRGEDGQLDFAPINAVLASADHRVVRIVPSGGLILDPAAVASLRERFTDAGRVAFVPSAASADSADSAVLVRQYDLVVLPTDSWVRLDEGPDDPAYGTTATGRLARDMTQLDIEPTEGELVTWAAELSAVPVTLTSQPGDSARSFGLRLPFDLHPGQQREATMGRIIADLSRFGLTTQDGSSGSPSTGDTGDTSGWRLEYHDGVEGGLVSPVLRSRRLDVAVTPSRPVWTELALVIGIVRRHGGVVSEGASGHLHIGVGDFGLDLDRMARMVGLVHAHQDALFRLALQPGARYDSGGWQARPLPELAGGHREQVRRLLQPGSEAAQDAFTLAPLAEGWTAGRASEGDRVESRFWAGDLDAGAIQARVRLWVAMADASEGVGQVPGPQSLGQHYGVADKTATVAALGALLLLLPKEAVFARAQVARLWALTDWLPPLTGGVRVGAAGAAGAADTADTQAPDPAAHVGGVVRVSADGVGEGVFDAGGSRLPGPGRFVDEVERAAGRSESEVWELVVVVEGYREYRERVESFVGGLLARGVLVATQDDGGRWVVRGRDLTTADGVEQYPDGELRRAVDAARRGRNESLDRLTGAVNRKLAAVEARRPDRLREVFGHEVYASWRELSTTGSPRLHNINDYADAIAMRIVSPVARVGLRGGARRSGLDRGVGRAAAPSQPGPGQASSTVDGSLRPGNGSRLAVVGAGPVAEAVPSGRVDVGGGGWCLFYATIVAAPELVESRLGQPDLVAAVRAGRAAFRDQPSAFSMGSCTRRRRRCERGS